MRDSPDGSATESDTGTDPVASADPTGTSALVPVLRVVRGDLTPEELAALVAVVAARNAAAVHAASRTPERPRSEWGHPAHLVRQPLRVGPDQWRRSAWG